MILCLDWDDTLVDVETQEWLPGAERAVKDLLRAGHDVVVCSCRATWPEGLDQIEHQLREARLADVPVTAVKPYADLYVDDKSFEFCGDWAVTLEQLKGLK